MTLGSNLMEQSARSSERFLFEKNVRLLLHIVIRLHSAV